MYGSPSPYIIIQLSEYWQFRIHTAPHLQSGSQMPFQSWYSHSDIYSGILKWYSRSVIYSVLFSDGIHASTLIQDFSEMIFALKDGIFFSYIYQGFSQKEFPLRHFFRFFRDGIPTRSSGYLKTVFPLIHLFRIFRDGIPTQTFIQDFQGWYSNSDIYLGF